MQNTSLFSANALHKCLFILFVVVFFDCLCNVCALWFEVVFFFYYHLDHCSTCTDWIRVSAE